MAKKFIRPIRIDGNSAYITLTRGYEAIIDAADVHLVDKWNWTALVGTHNVYAVRNTWNKKYFRLHRVIMSEPDGLDVDHRDGNGLDCRRRNLRVATHQQNCVNQCIKSSNTSGFKGVSWHKGAGKWTARIMVKGKERYLGLFTEKSAAIAAYAKGSAEYHGEFGRLE